MAKARPRSLSALLGGAQRTRVPVMASLDRYNDAGKVTARKEDINFEDLEDSYGIGMRFIGLKGYAFRVEVAHSREHQARLLVSAGGTF